VASYDFELIQAARRLLARRAGQRGKLASARIRRSISTTYYAIFHFLLEEASLTLIGTRNEFRRPRRTFVRAFTHTGMKTALDKVRNPAVDHSVADFFRTAGPAGAPVMSPPFAREIAAAFADAQAKRHDADYDLNKPLSELDAGVLINRVFLAIAGWRQAKTRSDKDFKHAVCMLMLLKGNLRRES
jgi:hypothetical protein